MSGRYETVTSVSCSPAGDGRTPCSRLSKYCSVRCWEGRTAVSSRPRRSRQMARASTGELNQPIQAITHAHTTIVRPLPS